MGMGNDLVSIIKLSKYMISNEVKLFTDFEKKVFYEQRYNNSNIAIVAQP